MVNFQWTLAPLTWRWLPLAHRQGLLLSTRLLGTEFKIFISLWIPVFGFRYCPCIVLGETDRSIFVYSYTRKHLCVCISHLLNNVSTTGIQVWKFSRWFSSQQLFLAMQRQTFSHLLLHLKWRGCNNLLLYSSLYNFGWLLFIHFPSMMVEASCFCFSLFHEL